MKKKLLFVIPSLHSGGAEKSLISLLQALDYTQYDVDLFLFRREGLFLPLVPPAVRVFDAGEDYRMFDGDARAAVRYFLRRGKILCAWRRYRYAKAQLLPHAQRVEQSWKYLSSMLPHLSGYDDAIAYLEGTSTYFVVSRVRAARKIAFLHTNYDFIRGNAEMDAPFYRQTDALVSVSEVCCDKAVQYFPFLEGKVVCLANIVSPAFIRGMAQEEVEFPGAGDGSVLLTVGRLADPKRLDRAVRACAILHRRGLDVHWYVIGTGLLENALREQARAEGVEDRFILLGERSNPYPYIRLCDVYVQTSQYEGKSIAVDEAKCLAKPIVVTNFETVYDQITDGVNGVIVPMEPEAIADAIERLLHAKETRETLSRNLRSEKVGTEEEVQKFCALL